MGLLEVGSGWILPSDVWAALKEARALWVTRWEYTTKTGGYSPYAHRAKIREIMDDAKWGRFNMVIFQVRGRADAFYRSHYEPWAMELTGTLGQDPGWDPLAYAIQEAHKRGLELHAWINTFTAWSGSSPPPHTTPEHPYNAHPEWLCVSSSGDTMRPGQHYAFFSPGIPEVRQHILNVAMDIVQNYDIDGLHFDYIRYPGRNYSWDEVSRMRWQDPVENPNNLSWEDWQREQINQLVRDFYDMAMEVKPMLKVSAAVIGKYDYFWTGWDGYNYCYQDGRRWMEEGKMDFLAPMIYWRIGQLNPWAPFEVLLRDWVYDNSFGRHIYAGIGAYKLTSDYPELQSQIDISRIIGAEGFVFFSYTALDQAGFFNRLRNDRFRYLANVPPMPWKDNIPPEAPQNVQIVHLSPSIVQITWRPPPPASDGDGAAYYNVYRAANEPVNPNNLAHLHAIVTDTVFTEEVDSSVHYRYRISALDKADNEGPLSDEVISVVSLASDTLVPRDFKLYQNFPNPFRAGHRTLIRYQLVHSIPQETRLTIYNLQGQEVITLVDALQGEGEYLVSWDGLNARGQPVSAGLYVALLQSGPFQQAIKLMILR